MMNALLPPPAPARRPLPTWVPVLGVVLAAHLLILLVWTCSRPRRDAGKTGAEETAAFTNALLEATVRTAPDRFPVDTHLPPQPEGQTSGSIDMGTFSPGRELTYIDDPRVWWESDNDEGDDEDDHTVHRRLELPLRRLIALVDKEGGRLKVQDTYRPTGVHNPRSLHREGRAIDLTCEGLTTERLASLCWMAGFDWVFHEGATRSDGKHVHASVRRSDAPVAPGASGPSAQTDDVD